MRENEYQVGHSQCLLRVMSVINSDKSETYRRDSLLYGNGYAGTVVFLTRRFYSHRSLGLQVISRRVIRRSDPSLLLCP